MHIHGTLYLEYEKYTVVKVVEIALWRPRV